MHSTQVASNSKTVVALAVLCLLAGVVLNSCKEAPKDSSPPQSTAQPAQVKPNEAPRPAPWATRTSSSAAEDVEERRVEARIEAIQALEESNDAKAVTALGNALFDPNREVKEAALQALAEKQGSNVTQLIAQALKDADPEFRMEVLDVLADRGDRESLLKAKSDPNEEVRERAKDLLESIGR